VHARLATAADAPRAPVSVLIPSWNSGDLLARCLESLRGEAADIVVVDNASGDGSADMTAARFPDVTLVRSATNLGFAGALNEAARHARGRYLLLLNPDTEASPGAVDRLARFVDAQPRCGAAAARLVDERGRPQAEFGVRRFPTLGSWAVDLLLIDKLWPSNPVTRRYRARDLSFAGPTEVEQPAAACLLVRRDAFEQLGGLDDAFYPAWFEDVDFCRRLRAAGWSIYLVPDAVFRHRGGVAMDALGIRAFSSVWYRNLERYVRKHQGAASLVAVKAMIGAGMIARAAVAAARGRGGDAAAYLRVLGRTLTSWPHGMQNAKRKVSNPER